VTVWVRDRSRRRRRLGRADGRWPCPHVCLAILPSLHFPPSNSTTCPLSGIWSASERKRACASSCQQQQCVLLLLIASYINGVAYNAVPLLCCLLCNAAAYRYVRLSAVCIWHMRLHHLYTMCLMFNGAHITRTLYFLLCLYPSKSSIILFSFTVLCMANMYGEKDGREECGRFATWLLSKLGLFAIWTLCCKRGEGSEGEGRGDLHFLCCLHHFVSFTHVPSACCLGTLGTCCCWDGYIFRLPQKWQERPEGSALSLRLTRGHVLFDMVAFVQRAITPPRETSWFANAMRAVEHLFAIWLGFMPIAIAVMANTAAPHIFPSPLVLTHGYGA